MNKFCLITIILFFLSLTLPKLTHASAILRVSPVIINLQLVPGSNTTKEVFVENLLDTPLPLKVVFSDFETATEDGGYILKNTPSPMLSWIKIDRPELIIPPKSKEKITLNMQMPEQIPFGAYYSLLFLEPIMPEVSQQVLVSSRVGVLILGDLGSADKEKGEILDFSLPRLSQDHILPLLLRVKNTSSSFFTAKPILKFKSLLTGSIYSTPIDEKIVFPGKVRRWEINLTPINYGLYQADLVLSTGHGETINASKIILILPWIQILIIISCLTTIVFLFSKRNKLRYALHIMLQGK